MADVQVPEPQEVTLADIVRILWSRKLVLGIVFILCVGGGVGYTLLQTPQYTSTATLVAVEQQDIIQRWLESRQAATWVGEQLGAPIQEALGATQTPEAMGRKIAEITTVNVVPPVSGRLDRTMRISVEAPDPGIARDVANAFVQSLELIRPQLQNVTESTLFAQFYDGQNAADARRQAHEVALEREYWIPIDPAYAATSPSSPNVTLNIALSVVLGLLLGVVAAFTWQWVANYRASSRAPVVPAAPPSDGASTRFRYRGP